MILSDQYIPGQMGHMLRLSFQKSAAQQAVPFGSGFLRRTDFDPFPVQKIPGGAGQLIAPAQKEYPFAILVADIGFYLFLVIEHYLPLPGF